MHDEEKSVLARATLNGLAVRVVARLLHTPAVKRYDRKSQAATAQSFTPVLPTGMYSIYTKFENFCIFSKCLVYKFDLV